jgi:hypothetical protein
MVQVEPEHRIVVAKVVVPVGPNGIVERLNPADPQHLRRSEASLGQFRVSVPVARRIVVVMAVAVAMAVVRRMMVVRWRSRLGIFGHRKTFG